jgi:hypothetical protein
MTIDEKLHRARYAVLTSYEDAPENIDEHDAAAVRRAGDELAGTSPTFAALWAACDIEQNEVEDDETVAEVVMHRLLDVVESAQIAVRRVDMVMDEQDEDHE